MFQSVWGCVLGLFVCITAITSGFWGYQLFDFLGVPVHSIGWQFIILLIITGVTGFIGGRILALTYFTRKGY